jgi:succinoglycan biosynthesis protein ExoM
VVTAAEQVRVTIGILTFRRPEDLRGALPLLLGQARELERPDLAIDVLVVDNDPSGSGRSVVDDLGSSRVRYIIEHTPGIAAARNRALDEAAGSTFLVFVDDDERPHPGWLAALLDTQGRTGAAAVVGPVVSEFPTALDPWISVGGFFQRRRLPTGTPTDEAATNNMLLDLGHVQRAGLRFDPAFGLSGGEDSLFSRRLTAGGGVIVWCDEAVVTDRVPVDRMTRGWVLRRAFSHGNSRTRVDLALVPSSFGRLRTRLRVLGSSVPRLVVGVAHWAWGSLVRSARHQARGLRLSARGAGMLAGAVGFVDRQYGRHRRGRRRGAGQATPST